MFHIPWSVIWWWDVVNVVFWGSIIGFHLSFKLLQAIVSFVGFSGIRTRNRECQTATITYEHPATKRRVVCVGMVHIAEPAYFQGLQKMVDGLKDRGYAVLYEFIVPPTEAELVDLSDEEKNLVRGMPQTRKAMEAQAAHLDLVYQKHALTYPPSWTRTDMSGVEFVGALSCLAGGSPLSSLMPQEAPEGYQRLMTMQLNGMFKTFPFWCMLLNLMPLYGLAEQIRGLFIVRRNEIAVRGIRKHLAQGDVVTLWGAGHLWGIGNHLKRKGFVEVGREWNTVYHIRRYGWRESTRLKVHVYRSLFKKLLGPA